MKFKNKNIFTSFKFAFSGLKVIFKEEYCFRIEFAAAVLASLAAFYFPLTPTEKVVVLIMIFVVLTAELSNSVLERVLDLVSPQFNKKVEKIKDMLAAIVLFSSLVALIVGLIIFLPYLLDKLAS
jgi:diacylglycerol kinase